MRGKGGGKGDEREVVFISGCPMFAVQVDGILQYNKDF